jgi:hypothetical protein
MNAEASELRKVMVWPERQPQPRRFGRVGVKRASLHVVICSATI